MTKELWFDDQQGQKPFQSPTAYKRAERHSIQWVLGVLYPGLNQVWHSPLSSAKFSKESSYTLTALYTSMARTFTVMCVTTSLHCTHLV